MYWLVKKRTILLSLAFFLLLGTGLYWRLNQDQPENQTRATPETSNAPTKKKPAAKPAPNLQPALDTWLSKNNGTYGIVMRDLSADKVIASHNSSDTFFMASIYKLHVAYLALIDAQAGVHDLGETYLNGWSRQKCIDQMIRTSHSPCGEKYMAELDREIIEQRLAKFGLTDTDYGAFVTSARDIDKILTRLHMGKELNDSHSKILLDAMQGQIYRDTIVKGLPAGAKSANKIGFRGLVEYHDVAIVTAANGESYTLVIFSENAGTKRLVDLTQTLLSALPR